MTVYLLSNSGMTEIIGPRGTTPEWPAALFAKGDVVRLRKLKHLSHLPEIGVVVATVPPGFSSDWVVDDLFSRPRRLMCVVAKKYLLYLVAFEGESFKMVFLKEKYLKKTDLPKADIVFSKTDV